MTHQPSNGNQQQTQALRDAAYAGKTSHVSRLLADGANVNDADSDNGITALMAAVSGGHRKIIDLLLDAGADINAVQTEGQIGAFGLALDNRRIKLALYLLERGARPDFGDADTLPLAVAEHGSLALIHAIESRGGSIIQPHQLASVAFVAARNPDGAVLDHVLSHGADLQHGNDFGYTPLILAALTNHPDLVQQYLARGDDPAIRDADSETALSLAIDKNHPAVIAVLRHHAAEVHHYPDLTPQQAMLRAATDGALGTLLNLHDCGVSFGLADGQGNTPLMLAAQAGHVGVVRSLFHLGASISHRNQAGLTAGDLAQQAGHTSLLNTLTEFGDANAVKLVYGIETDGAPTFGLADTLIGRLSHPCKERPPYDNSAAEDSAQVSLSDDESDDETDDEAADDETDDEAALDAEVAEKLDQLESMLDWPHIQRKLDDEKRQHILQRINQIRLLGTQVVPKAHADDLLEWIDVFQNAPVEDVAEPPLFQAVTQGDLGEFTRLLAAGEDLHATLADGTSLLMRATEKGHQALVAALLKAGVNANQRRADSLTALLLAVFLANEAIVKILVKGGADINMGHSLPSSRGATGGQTALTVAAQRKNLSMCQLLVKLGADVNVVSEVGYTPLMWSLANASTDEVALFLLQAGAAPDPDTVPQILPSARTSPLVLAATNAQTEVVKALIDRQVRLDKPDGGGWTALKRAALVGCAEVVKLLIEAGAAVNVADHEGWTALMNAAGKGNLAVVLALLEVGADVNLTSASDITALTQAVGWYNDQKALNASRNFMRMFSTDDDTADDDTADTDPLNLIRLLLDQDANPNATRDGTPLLEEALDNDDEELAELLRTYGALENADDLADDEAQAQDASPPAAPHVSDELGEALIDAVRDEGIARVKELVANDAPLDYVNARGDTALSRTVMMLSVDVMSRRQHRDSRELADYLLQQGASVNVAGCDPSALGMAAHAGDLYLLRAMVQRGADLDVRLLGKSTPLMSAIVEGHEDCALALIEAGASLQARLARGETLLHVACDNNWPRVISALLTMSPNLADATDDNGLTPLMVATGLGHSEAVQILLAFNATPGAL